MREGITVAITGASGVQYGIRLVDVLLEKGKLVNLIISKWAFKIIKEECEIDLQKDFPQSVRKYFKNHRNLGVFEDHDLSLRIASGSARELTMVVIPCSMGTLGRIASGMSTTLIERSADVVLKERGKLIVVPRETPLNAIHLENMLRLERAGAHIIPAMPAFYHKPKSVTDMVDFIVGKVLDALGIEHQLYRRWK